MAAFEVVFANQRFSGALSPHRYIPRAIAHLQANLSRYGPHMAITHRELDDSLAQKVRIAGKDPDIGRGGNTYIEGLTLDEAKTLAIQLNAGALPVPISIVQEQTVDATLGADSLRKSLIAGEVGLGVVPTTPAGRTTSTRSTSSAHAG